jgi:alpha-mannosidase
VAVRALKRAEDGDGWILRLQELYGQSSSTTIECAAPVLSITEVDGMEEPLAGRQPLGSLHLSLERFQPRTLRLGLEPPFHRLGSPRSRQLTLPDLMAAASRQGRPVAFDDRGRSFPAELMPRSLEIGGIELELAAGGTCCRCAGQTITLPEGDWQHLWLIACAVGGDCTARFGIDDQAFELTVGDWREPLGCWRQRIRGRLRPGFIKRHPVAFYASHGHDAAGKDEPYEFRYLFRYALRLTAGDRLLRLPDEPRIRVFAMAVASGGPGAATTMAPLYD